MADKAKEMLAALAGSAGGEITPSKLASMADAAAKKGEIATDDDDCLITMVELALAFESLRALADQPMRGEVATKIVRLNRWATPYYKRYLKARTTNAERYGEKVSETQWKIEDPKKKEEFLAAMEPVNKSTVMIPSDLKVSSKDLADLKLTPTDVDKLSAFVADMQNEEEK